MPDVLDPAAFNVETTNVRGFTQTFVRQGAGGVPLLLVHGWPETKRIWWRNIAPLAAAGFEVIVPDLRGFGESAIGPGWLPRCPQPQPRSLRSRPRPPRPQPRRRRRRGSWRPVIQDLSLRFPGFVDRMVLFNSPLPFDKDGMAGMRTRPAREASDYFVRQGTDADALASELDTPEKRRRYIATFYTSRFWAHPGAFEPAEVDFMTEPFADGAHLRASFGAYESSFNAAARSEPSVMATPNPTHTLILFGPSDHVIYPEYDRMAAVVFPDHVGPFLVRDSGHFLQWEAADVLNGAIKSFCRDLL